MSNITIVVDLPQRIQSFLNAYLELIQNCFTPEDLDAKYEQFEGALTFLKTSEIINDAEIKILKDCFYSEYSKNVICSLNLKEVVKIKFCPVLDECIVENIECDHCIIFNEYFDNSEIANDEALEDLNIFECFDDDDLIKFINFEDSQEIDEDDLPF